MILRIAREKVGHRQGPTSQTPNPTQGWAFAFAAIWLDASTDVAAKELEPLGPGHELELAFQARAHLRAVDDAAGGRVVGHLLERHGARGM